MNPKVYLNGQLIENVKATVPVSNPGLLHGVGLFETLRSYDGRPFKLPEHIERLRASAVALNMPVDDAIEKIPVAVEQVLDANKLKDARIRFTVIPPGPQTSSAEPTLLVAAEATAGYPAELYEQGMMVYVCDTYRQSKFDPLVGHKTTSYLSRLLALRNAHDRACGEALWFTPDNYLAEGSISNIFIVKNGQLRTPPLDTPILPGVTRATVLQIARQLECPTEETACTLKDLLEADEIFLTNAIMEIMPVTNIERKPVANEKPGPLTQKLAVTYQALI